MSMSHNWYFKTKNHNLYTQTVQQNCITEQLGRATSWVMTTQKTPKQNKMVQPCSEDQEKMKYRNLYKNTRHNTIRIWSFKDIILSKLYNIWFRFEEAKHVSSTEKEALLLWKLGMKIISPGTHLNTPLLHSYIHKVKFLISFWSLLIHISYLIFWAH